VTQRTRPGTSRRPRVPLTLHALTLHALALYALTLGALTLRMLTLNALTLRASTPGQMTTGWPRLCLPSCGYPGSWSGSTPA
jgi:hypothetical protein